MLHFVHIIFSFQPTFPLSEITSLLASAPSQAIFSLKSPVQVFSSVKISLSLCSQCALHLLLWSSHPSILSNDLFTCLNPLLDWRQSWDDFVSHSAVYLTDQKMFWMATRKNKLLKKELVYFKELRMRSNQHKSQRFAPLLTVCQIEMAAL